jgi:lipid-A-disaccharide synthase
MKSIFIAAGESSGERYGADIIREFQKMSPLCSFFGIGGKQMKAAGVEIILPIEELSAVGIFEVLARLLHFRKIFHRLGREVEARKPTAAMLIDSPDFNLRLARKLKKCGIPVLYYISPTVWAWRSGRLKTIKKFVDQMLLIFPFEVGIYADHGIPASFVGHPLKHKVKVQLSRAEFQDKHGLPAGEKLISLLPGSRPTELKNHLSVLLEAVRRMKDGVQARFLLLLAENINPGLIARYLRQVGEPVQVLSEDHYEAIAYSEIALSACGTANLEVALIGTPLIAFYRVSPLTYYPFRRLVKIHNYSIVNILAGKTVVPELIQSRFTATRLTEMTRIILSSEQKKAAMRAEFKRIKENLGEARAAENAARELERIIVRQSDPSAAQIRGGHTDAGCAARPFRS